MPDLNDSHSTDTTSSQIAAQASVANTNAITELTTFLTNLDKKLDNLATSADSIAIVLKAFESAIKALNKEVSNNTKAQQDNTKEQKNNSKKQEDKKERREEGLYAGFVLSSLGKVLPNEFRTGLNVLGKQIRSNMAAGSSLLGASLKAIPAAGFAQAGAWGLEVLKGLISRTLNETKIGLRGAILSPYKEDRSRGFTDWQKGIQEFRLMGYTDEEIDKITSGGWLKGLSFEASQISAAAQTYYGLQGADTYTLMMMRRAGVESSNLSKAFGVLRISADEAGLGMQEAADFQTSYLSSVKGGGFNAAVFGALTKELSPLIKTNQISGAELAGLLDVTHRTSQTQLMGLAQFAKMGGYNFKSGDNLLANAYELRRMQGGDIKKQIPFLQSALKGVYGRFGLSNFNQATGAQREIILENVLSKFGFDVSKIPDAETIIRAIEQGNVVGEAENILKKASQSPTEQTNATLMATAQGISALSDPINFIKEILWSFFTSPTKVMRYTDQDRERFEKEAREQTHKVNVEIYNSTGVNLEAKATTAGAKADTVS